MVDHTGRRGYDSDLTDAQWELVEPLLPPERGGREFGRPLTHPRREIVNAILYLARAGCSWRQLPGDLPPWATVYDYVATWKADGTVDRIHDGLRDAVRDEAGRDPMAEVRLVAAVRSGWETRYRLGAEHLKSLSSAASTDEGIIAE